MLIRWAFRGRYYSLDIGHETPWFEQVWLISLVREYYEGRNVVYAYVIWAFGGTKEYKKWRKKCQ